MGVPLLFLRSILAVMRGVSHATLTKPKIKKDQGTLKENRKMKREQKGWGKKNPTRKEEGKRENQNIELLEAWSFWGKNELFSSVPLCTTWSKRRALWCSTAEAGRKAKEATNEYPVGCVCCWEGWLNVNSKLDNKLFFSLSHGGSCPSSHLLGV